jgi:HSP20 family protein
MARELSKEKKGSQPVERKPSRGDVLPGSYSPFSMMRRFAEDMDRVFGGFGFPSVRHFGRGGWGAESRFSPDLEILERDKKLIIRADLPGLNKEDVTVDISEHTLTIEGERKQEHESTEAGVYTSERSYGHFRREIPLPEGVKPDTAKANFKNGTLEITLDVPEAAKNQRRIEIREGETDTKKGETAA